MTASTPAQQLDQLQRTDFGPWIGSLWLLKRRLDSHKQARYTVRQVDLSETLRERLKNAVVQRVQVRPTALEDYEVLSADPDGRLLVLPAADTDFPAIQHDIDQGLANAKVDRYEDLLGSWAFVVKLEWEGRAVYGVRKISRLTRATRVASVSYFLFEDKRLVDLDDKKIFTLDTQIDFFVSGGTAFIRNKKEFESAMNFRAGMQKQRDGLLSEFLDLGLFTDVQPLRKAVGANLHMLRKLASIQKSGYYKDRAFLHKLIRRNAEAGWGLAVEDGKIVVNDANVDLVLTLLNNSRLMSTINEEVFDAAVKKRVR